MGGDRATIAVARASQGFRWGGEAWHGLGMGGEVGRVRCGWRESDARILADRPGWRIGVRIGVRRRSDRADEGGPSPSRAARRGRLGSGGGAMAIAGGSGGGGSC